MTKRVRLLTALVSTGRKRRQQGQRGGRAVRMTVTAWLVGIALVFSSGLAQAQSTLV
jgi:hypothetical protein